MLMKKDSIAECDSEKAALLVKLVSLTNGARSDPDIQLKSSNKYEEPIVPERFTVLIAH